jgi:hypothetical protein
MTTINYKKPIPLKVVAVLAAVIIILLIAFCYMLVPDFAVTLNGFMSAIFLGPPNWASLNYINAIIFYGIGFGCCALVVFLIAKRKYITGQKALVINSAALQGAPIQTGAQAFAAPGQQPQILQPAEEQKS